MLCNEPDMFPHGITSFKLPGPAAVTYKNTGPAGVIKPALLVSESRVAGSDSALPASAGPSASASEQ